MKTLDIVSRGVGNDSRRVRGSAALLLCVFGLGLTFFVSLPAPARGQTSTGNRESRLPAINQGTIMTKVKAARAPRTKPTVRSAAEKNNIRPFQYHASDSALTDLRRRLRATRWP